jgi:hydrogenase expression/formation protein HypC
MQILEIAGFTARCSARGVEREVSLFMLRDDVATVGDYVIVHTGYAIQKVCEADARRTWELFDELLAADGSHA